MGTLLAMADQPKTPPANLPKPGTSPKAPRNIFNYEKRGGDSKPRPKAT
jgi:hypothetical protein